MNGSPSEKTRLPQLVGIEGREHPVSSPLSAGGEKDAVSLSHMIFSTSLLPEISPKISSSAKMILTD